MSDIAQILGVEDKPREGAEEKKPKKTVKNDPYANLPRYLRNIVDENNPPPLELFKEKKSCVFLLVITFSISDLKGACA